MSSTGTIHLTSGKTDDHSVAESGTVLAHLEEYIRENQHSYRTLTLGSKICLLQQHHLSFFWPISMLAWVSHYRLIPVGIMCGHCSQAQDLSYHSVISESLSPIFFFFFSSSSLGYP